MKPPKSAVEDPQGALFQTELAHLVDPQHPLVRLAGEIDWSSFETAFGAAYADSKVGRPPAPTRLLVALHYLKYTFDLSDEGVLLQWVENPYWQYFSGEKFFQHEAPIDPSSMSRWRTRVGDAGAEQLLKESIQAGVRLNLIKPSQVARVNVDTTVMEKNVRHPTDARLLERAREKLVKRAQAEGIRLRQSYVRVGKQALLMQSRYAHAKQFKRAKREERKLRTILGRVIRDVERKATSPSRELKELLVLVKRLHAQKRTDKGKLYSLHEPDVACISKGKAHKRYEFGCKVALAVTSQGGWVLAAKAMPGNPYDGHTLKATLEQASALTGKTLERVYVDMGYRGHGYEGPVIVNVDKRRRGRTPRSVWRWMKRRSAIEPTIGHLKEHKRLNRNRLKGVLGDKMNALLAAAALNLHKIMRALAKTPALLARILVWLLDALELRRLSPAPSGAR
jgi:IS5 family transposase